MISFHFVSFIFSAYETCHSQSLQREIFKNNNKNNNNNNKISIITIILMMINATLLFIYLFI